MKKRLTMKKRGERIVVALGGNALIKKGQKPTISNQSKTARKSLEYLIPLIKNNHVLITHGSGPQVGDVLLQNQLSKLKVSPLPLDVIDAEVQGELGYILEQNLQNIFAEKKINKRVMSILTQVIVDKNDPAFKHPTKPIGQFYSKAQAAKLKKKGIHIVEQIGKGWRRVVASPKPKSIDDVDIIEHLISKGIVIIAAGGGGIPVIKEKNKIYGIQAVIDKDLASACLANSINASTLIILTDELCVYLNYKRPNQKPLRKLNITQAQTYFKQGQFPSGSMGPKIEASITFLKKGGKKAIITSSSSLQKALKGQAGTTITR